MPSEKRARQRAAREARLAAEAQQHKRRLRIRNGVIVVVVLGAIVGIAFAVSGGNKTVGSQSATSSTTTTVAKSADAQLQAQANEVAVKAGCPASTKTKVNDQTYSAAPADDDQHLEHLHGHGEDHRRGPSTSPSIQRAPHRP